MAELSKIRKNGVDYDIKDAVARKAIEDLEIPESGVTDEQIASAVEDYFAENPVTGGGLTTEQITALDNMFKVCAFTEADVSDEYNAFCAAFGIVPDEPDIPDVPDHTHSYTSTVTKEATCETAGVRTFTCSCGHSYTQSIPATGHNYVGGVCANCGAADPDTETGNGELAIEWTDGKNYFNGIIDADGQSISQIIDATDLHTLTITTDSATWFSVPKCYDTDTNARINNKESANYMGGTHPMKVTHDISASNSIIINCETGAKTKIVIKVE